MSRRVLVCGGAGCVSSGCLAVRKALEEALQEASQPGGSLREDVQVVVTGCVGACAL
ncbi:MAG TPA: (2Fe-2S) ferredoxin domain-containing protein, partial [Firmicutes bacterium]|nr:(2Fe-2S) ferredoxin domain-containing protein [Bacillota bacterium]